MIDSSKVITIGYPSEQLGKSERDKVVKGFAYHLACIYKPYCSILFYCIILY